MTALGPTRYCASWTGGLSTMWDAQDDVAARADLALWRDTAYSGQHPYELVALDGGRGPDGKVQVRKVQVTEPVLPLPPVTSRSV